MNHDNKQGGVTTHFSNDQNLLKNDMLRKDKY